MADKKPAPKAAAKGAVKKGKPGRQLWKAYEITDGKITRKNKFSPKSPGDFLAEHKDRRTCGKTGYMEKTK